jgi:Ca2+-binding EF-hand superfamily protein
MKKIMTLLLAAGLAATLTCDLATAQRKGKKGHRGAKIFKKLDTNKDGKISKAEAGDRWARLGKADADNDGFVTKEELKAFAKGRKGKKGKRRKGKGKKKG